MVAGPPKGHQEPAHSKGDAAGRGAVGAAVAFRW
jgi:hypothetical protein